MKRALPVVLSATIAFLLLCGCVQPVPQPGGTCAQFCESQPHVQCVGQWKISGTYPGCNCSFECEEGPQVQCAKEGEQYSAVYTEDYPANCCEGLTEWESGMDSRVSIADKCYETGLLKGSPVGTCIKCGNGRCEANEQPCNCPQDCNGAGASDYNSIEEFCSSAFSKTVSQECSIGLDLPLCGLCAPEEPGCIPCSQGTQYPESRLPCTNFVYSNCPDYCVKKFVEDSAVCPLGESVICDVDFDVAGSCVEPE